MNFKVLLRFRLAMALGGLIFGLVLGCHQGDPQAPPMRVAATDRAQ
jgi:hypothetical protein